MKVRIRVLTTVRAACAVAFSLWIAGAHALHASCIPFLRADANEDGLLNIADGVSTLNFLFAGGPRPPCMDAADANDSGGVDISDALYTLNFLFVDGPAPPGYPWCQEDETPDDLFCERYLPCGPPSKPRGFLPFESFEYGLQPGLGFCPELGSVLHASITIQDDDRYWLELSVVEEGEEGDPRCLFGLDPSRCFIEVSQKPRVLTDDEIVAMTNLPEVQIITGPDPICRCVAIDPCLITEYRWDGLRASDYICHHGTRVNASSARPLVNFIESLRD